MLSAAKHLEGGQAMLGEVRRLYEEAGGQGFHPEWEHLRMAPSVLPDATDLEEAAALLLAHKHTIEQRFGVTAWSAFEKLVNRSTEVRGRTLPLVPLTQRFIETL